MSFFRDPPQTMWFSSWLSQNKATPKRVPENKVGKRLPQKKATPKRVPENKVGKSTWACPSLGTPPPQTMWFSSWLPQKKTTPKRVPENKVGKSTWACPSLGTPPQTMCFFSSLLPQKKATPKRVPENKVGKSTWACPSLGTPPNNVVFLLASPKKSSPKKGYPEKKRIEQREVSQLQGGNRPFCLVTPNGGRCARDSIDSDLCWTWWRHFYVEHNNVSSHSNNDIVIINVYVCIASLRGEFGSAPKKT